VIVYLNGRYLSRADATVSIDDRGFLFADGVFETALLHDGGFFRLRQHLRRFADSAAMLRLTAPPAEMLEEVARALARENGLASGSLRFTLTRGSGEPTLLVTLSPEDPDAHARARRGWHLVTAATRRPSTASAPAQLKALGRTYALLARHEARDAGADDALLLTDAGSVCEGPTWNVFWRARRTLFTPGLDLGVLAGVTRAIIIELAADAGYDVREGDWPRTDLDAADEVFVTMTSVGLVPARSLDGRVLDPAAEAATALQPRYWRRVAEEAAAHPL
jgi:branched-chain amino acid aminotransferase